MPSEHPHDNAFGTVMSNLSWTLARDCHCLQCHHHHRHKTVNEAFGIISQAIISVKYILG